LYRRLYLVQQMLYWLLGLRTPVIQNTYSPSICPPLLPLYLRTPAVTLFGCSWRPCSCVFRDALGGKNRASVDMHLETEIAWTQRCAWRPGSSKFGDSLGYWQIEWTQRGTWRPWLSEFGDDAVRGECSTQCMLYLVYAVLGVCCTRCMLY
jgi:hypothetical protein